VGKDVEKSLTPQIHRFILQSWGINCEYEKFSVDAQSFDGVMQTLLGDFDGFNVTIPYKRDVMEYLDGLQGDAIRFGAVNTVVCASKEGHNTDGVGFMKMLQEAGVAVKGKKILVLGGGGAGRSTLSTLKKAGAQVYLYQRNAEKRKETCVQLDVLEEENPNRGGYDVLVNCTGVGMHDSVGRSPVEERAFDGATAAVDLIYEPQETAFMAQAKARGAKAVGGLAMLFYQAYYADCLYVGRKADEQEAERLYSEYLKIYKRG
ncbi:MAG: shikimate dehydrogenase, partial [Clostridia bacterium]|nr:shikimate dehydrogenase [Clostridia bacterium]